MTYYLISDVGTQWFHYLISTDGNKVQFYCDISTSLASTPYLTNIYRREMHFGYRKFETIGQMQTGPFGGWTISEREFAHIKRMADLEKGVMEYNKLAEVS